MSDELPMPLSLDSAKDWWGHRRRDYNFGLVVAGLLAFICFVAVTSWGMANGALPDAEITVFTTAFQAVGYLIMMLVANAFYSLGPLCERFVKPIHLNSYRVITFRLGFWFSVLLPFSIPVLLFVLITASLILRKG